MKRKILSLTLFVACGITNVFSQGFFTEISGGYSYMLAPQHMGTNSSFIATDTEIKEEHKLIKGSYGQGLNFGLKLGYMINSNFGVDLNTSYLTSSKFEYSDYEKHDNAWAGYYETTTNRYEQAKMLRFNPSIIMSMGNEKIAPFTKIGVVFGIGSVEQNVEQLYSNGNSTKYSVLVNGGVSIGASAEIGLKMKITQKLSFVGSLNLLAMNYAPKKGEYTTYTENGEDVLGSWQTSDREVNFVDEYSVSSSDPNNSNEPSKELKMYLPFSSIGLNVGIRFSL